MAFLFVSLNYTNCASKNTKINRQKFDDYRDLLQDHSEEKDIERV